jgi:hypothetical protein
MLLYLELKTHYVAGSWSCDGNALVGAVEDPEQSEELMMT